jgi:signal transduction histidine kinase
MNRQVDETFHLETDDGFKMMRDALRVFAATEDRIIRVVGRARQGSGSEIEVTLHEWPLRRAMIDYGLRIFYLSLLISVATAALLFFAVRRFIVRPIKRVVASMTAFRDDPEDASRIIQPQGGARELRQAETALNELQVGLTGALRQKERLAALGGAVAKISHDLRNLLTTTQILADRIEASSDPGVRRTAPKLVQSLARAITLCERTLAFGKAEEAPPEMAVLGVAALAAEVVESERLAASDTCIEIVTDIPADLQVKADADQLYRALSNLVRNAVQAIDATRAPGRVTISAEAIPGRTVIRVGDTGPGLPERARANLFRPFQGGVRQGGTGLGLVIASELVRGHGGSLTLESSGDDGTVFRIELPAP